MSKNLDVENRMPKRQDGTMRSRRKHHGLNDDYAIEIEGQGWASQARFVEKVGAGATGLWCSGNDGAGDDKSWVWDGPRPMGVIAV
jgi:hypothetical protein